MESKEKTHHHFVPQVYLRKFSHTIDKKGKKKIYFVSCFDKEENKSTEKMDIYYACAKKKLYSIESDKQVIRESVENFYAKNFESKYNDVYNLITDSTKTKINYDEREFLISWIISLHFRNYFWLKKFNDFSQEHIEHFGKNFNRNIYTENNKIWYEFETKSKEEILTKEKEENKQIFIPLHLKLMINLTKAHFADTIVVEHSSGKENLITSDKPVIWENFASSLRIPFDSKHLITLNHKVQVQDFNKSNIERMPLLIKPVMYNACQYDIAERHVIGCDLKSIEEAKIKFEEIKKTT